MEEGIFQIVEQINQLQKEAYDTCLPLVDDICAGGICILIRVALSLILMYIGRCEKMKMVAQKDFRKRHNSCKWN